MLDMKRLAVFREVARLCSFSAAADALNYSQPAVSHHIARLEGELGVRLLERSSSREGVRLTAAGSALMVHAERILDAARAAEEQMAALAAGEDVPVRVAAFATAAATLVADAVAAVRERHGGSAFSLAECVADEAITALARGRIDLAVVSEAPGHELGVPADVVVEHLLDDPLLVALPEGHARAAEEWLDLEDLREETWIDGARPDSPCALVLRDHCRATGFEPSIGLAASSFEMAARLVAGRQGVALVPLLGFSRPVAGVALRRLRARPVRRVAMVTRAGDVPGRDLARLVMALRRQGARWRVRAERMFPAATTVAVPEALVS